MREKQLMEEIKKLITYVKNCDVSTNLAFYIK